MTKLLDINGLEYLVGKVQNKIYLGSCSTTASSKNKVATTTETFPTVSYDDNGTTKYKPATGTVVGIKYTVSNTNKEADITLNVNSTGAWPFYYNNAQLAAVTSANTLVAGYKNRYAYYVFNGTQWVWFTASYDTNSTYSAMTQAEVDAGTGTTGRTITPQRLRDNFYTESEVDALLGGYYTQEEAEETFTQTFVVYIGFVEEEMEGGTPSPPHYEVANHNTNFSNIYDACDEGKRVIAESVDDGICYLSSYTQNEIIFKGYGDNANVTYTLTPITPLNVGDSDIQVVRNALELADVAVTGDYSDLIGTPTLSNVAESGSYNDLSDKPTIPTVPTNVSDFTNDANYAVDASYVHTDNNYTTTEKTKLSGIAAGAEVNVQSDWNQTTTTSDDYIKNKPDLSLKANVASPTFTGSPKAPTPSVDSDDTSIATTAFVSRAINNLPSPMVFKGSLGTGGTITALPVDGSATIGDTYKVITAGTYAGVSADVGDTFICKTKTTNANTWELIPSGDEPSGTVISVGLSMPTGFSVSNSPVVDSGTIGVTFSDGYSLPTTSKQTEWDNKVSSVKSIKSDNTSAQSTSSSEAISGSGTINLHKIAKTGTYSDLIGKPTIPDISGKQDSAEIVELTLIDGDTYNGQLSGTTYDDLLALFSGNNEVFLLYDDVTYHFVKDDGSSSLQFASVVNGMLRIINISSSDEITYTSYPLVTSSEKSTWNNKQNALTFDNSPTSGSNNPVKSGGVYTALSGKQDSLVSGTSIKTINSTSLLGSGDIAVQATINDLSTIRSGAALGATAYQKPSTGIPRTDLASAIQGMMIYKGRVATYENLPVNAEVGDVYSINADYRDVNARIWAADTDFIWTGDKWESLGGYWDEMTFAEIDAITSSTITHTYFPYAFEATLSDEWAEETEIDEPDDPVGPDEPIAVDDPIEGEAEP